METAQIPESVLAEISGGAIQSGSPAKILEWGLDRFAPRIALSASFGSPEGMVIFDLMQRIDPSRSRLFTIDTGRLPQETYNLMDRVRDRYGCEIELFFPQPEQVETLVRREGLNLFYESVEKRQRCCQVRKGEPLERALAGLDAWITGLRPDQSITRREVAAVEIDAAHGDRIKLNPLIRWSREDIESYVRQNHVPVNALHARGYPSVGCAPCSRAVEPGDDARSGRWWWETSETRECGIHTGFESDGSGI